MKYYLDKQRLITTPLLPDESFIEKILVDAGLIKFWYDPEIDGYVYKTKQQPRNALIYGIVWHEKLT